jgi:hypothetical protein
LLFDISLWSAAAPGIRSKKQSLFRSIKTISYPDLPVLTGGLLKLELGPGVGDSTGVVASGVGAAGVGDAIVADATELAPAGPLSMLSHLSSLKNTDRSFLTVKTTVSANLLGNSICIGADTGFRRGGGGRRLAGSPPPPPPPVPGLIHL